MRRKRLISLVLTLCMVLGMITGPAYADGVTSDSDGNASTALTITLTIPAAPTLASATKDSITLTAADGCEYSMDGTSWQDETTFSGLQPGTEYTFCQRVKNTQNVSASASFRTLEDTYALTITLTIKPTPDAPAAPTAASTTKNSVTLNAADGCEYSMDGTSWQDETTFSGLQPGTEYTFYQRIKSTETANASASSPAATISTAADTYGMTITLVIKPAQTITASDVTATYGDTGKSVSASVTEPTTGGGAISYAVKDGSGDYIDVNASTGALTIKKVPPTDGKAYVIVTAAETTAYAKTTKEVTVTISKAAVTVTAKNQSIYVNGTVPDLSSPVLDTHYTVTGLVGEDTLTTAPALAYQKNGSAATPDNTAAGTYDIAASGASAGDNYTISYTKGTLTVNAKQTQTISAENVTATYGDTGKSVSASLTEPATGGGAISYAVKTGSEDYIDVDATTGALTIKKVPPTDGKAYVIVTAAETAEYARATKEVTVTINTKAMTVSASGYTGYYDEQAHGITVTVTEPATGYTVKYGTTEGTYGSTASPTQTEAGTLTVYYQVTADNYTTKTGSATVTVNAKKTQTITAENVTATYGDTGKSVSASLTAPAAGGGVISYAVKTGSEDYIDVDASTGALTIKKVPPTDGKAYVIVTAAETAEYARATKEVTVTINTKAMTVSASGYTGYYDEQAHGITVTVTEPATGYTVKYGTTEGTYGSTTSPTQTEAGSLTVYYQVTADNYTAKTGSATVTVNAKKTQTITAENVTATYGDTGKSVSASLIEPATGGGAISYAVKSGSEDYIDVNASTGALTIKKAGTATVTVTAAETAAYAQATKDVTVTINTRAMTVSASGYTGYYDEQAHGITVTVTEPATGYTVKYGTTEGTYGSTASPTQTEAGTLTVYYQVTADNYTTKTGSATVTVNAKQTQTISAGNVTATYGDTGKSVSASVTTPAAGGGVISYAVKTGSEDYIDVNATTGALTIKKAGTATVTVTAAETAEYAQATKDVTVTINTKAMTVSASGYTGYYDEQAHGITVTVTEPATGYTVKYGTTEGTYDSATCPTQTEAGTLTVYYQVTADNYTAKTGSATVTVNAKQTQTISAENVTATYGDTGKSVSASLIEPATGCGAISYAVKTGSEDYIDVDADTGALTIKKAGTATVTVTAAETAEYAQATKDVTVTVDAKTVTVTADAKSKTFGDADPALTYTADGLVGTDTLTGTLSRAEGENAGTYAITIGTLSAGDNYKISYTGANLTINKAEQEAPALAVLSQPLTPYVTGSIGAQQGKAANAERLQVSAGSGGTWTDVTALPYAAAPGAYQFKYKGDGNYDESETTSLLVEPENELAEVKITSDQTDANLYRNGTENTLTAVTNANVEGLALSYSWYREGAEAPIGTEKSYVLQAADIGKKLTIVVTDRTQGAAEPYTSVSTATPEIVTVLPATYKVTGNVTVPTADDATTYDNYPNANVELRQGNTVFASATTDGDGQYRFHSVPNGEYNVVVTGTNGKTKTEYVKVESSDQTIDVIMPYYNVSSKLVVSGETPAAVVAGLDDAAVNSLTETEKAADVTTTLSMEIESVDDLTAMAAEQLTPEQEQTWTEQQAIKDVNSGANASACLDFLDLSVYRRIQKAGETAKISNVHETKTVLEILLPYVTANRSFGIFRYHDEVAKPLNKLNVRPTGSFTDGTFYVGSGFIVIYASGFSTYAIGYTEETAPTPIPSRPSGGYYIEDTYPVVTENASHGTVSTSTRQTTSGTRVTVTVTPDAGYQVDSVTVTDGSGRALNVTKVNDTTYTYSQPASKATVNASFTATAPASTPVRNSVCPRDGSCPVSAFFDTNVSAWYHDGVHYALQNGIMSGMGDGTFAPNGETTRAQMAQILWNLEGKPYYAGMLEFTDVDPEAWYAPAIRWAYAEGIMDGYGDGLFGTNDAMTREQLVTILYRYAQYKGLSVSASASLYGYYDADTVHTWAQGAMRWAVGSGLVTGKTEATLNPADHATRAEIATIMMRYCTEIAQ